MSQIHYLEALFEGKFSDNLFPLRVQSENLGNVEVFSSSRKISSQKVSDNFACCNSQILLFIIEEFCGGDP